MNDVLAIIKAVFPGATAENQREYMDQFIKDHPGNWVECPRCGERMVKRKGTTKCLFCKPPSEEERGHAHIRGSRDRRD